MILDDDATIHQIWRGRFESSRIHQKGVDVIHFSTPQELRNWLQMNALRWDETTYIIDYELLGHSETGLDLIETLGIQHHSILVTSRFDEDPIRKRCEKTGIKLIPKGMAGFVPIKPEAKETKEARAHA